MCVCACVHTRSVTRSCPDLVTTLTIARQAPLSMELLKARILECVAISYSMGSS